MSFLMKKNSDMPREISSWAWQQLAASMLCRNKDVETKHWQCAARLARLDRYNRDLAEKELRLSEENRKAHIPALLTISQLVKVASQTVIDFTANKAGQS